VAWVYQVSLGVKTSRLNIVQEAIALINRVYGGCIDPTYVVVIVGNTNSALAAKAMTRTVNCFRKFLGEQLTLGNWAASHRSRRRRNSS
jgi:hypothetical protein